MLNSTLLKILGSFTQQEIKEFKEFINSPFFNKNESVVTLFEYIKKFYPEFNDKKLEKEYVYKRLYGNGNYNDGFMRKVIFILSKLAEEYLTQVNLGKNKLRTGINLLEELNERKLEKIFLKNYNDLEDENENRIYQNSNYFYNKYLLQLQMEIFLNWTGSDKKDFQKILDDLPKLVYENLTCSYLHNVLKEYRFFIYKQTFEQHKFESDFFEHILDYLSNKDNFYREKPLIKLHLNEILLQKEKSLERFKILKEILINEVKSFSHSDRYSLQNILQSFCIGKIFGEMKASSEKGLNCSKLRWNKNCTFILSTNISAKYFLVIL